MEHCTGGSKEIKFNIQAREELKKLYTHKVEKVLGSAGKA